MADAPERIMITEAGIPVPCEPNESGGRLPEYVRADHYAELRRELTQKLACIQILANGDEPNIVSDFPAANDVRRLHGDYCRLRRAAWKATEKAEAELAELRAALENDRDWLHQAQVENAELRAKVDDLEMSLARFANTPASVERKRAVELRAVIDEHIKTRREALTLLNEGSTDAAIQCLLRAAIGKGEA